MSKKLLFGLLSILLLNSCRQETVNDKKLMRADDFNIVINHRDTIRKEEEMFASIQLANKNYKLIDAVYACNVTDTSTVDTLITQYSIGKIYGCNNNLIIERDSVKIWMMTGNGVGKINFEEITILAKGIDNKYYYQKCTFDFYVK